jgi:hypothetical protein
LSSTALQDFILWRLLPSRRAGRLLPRLGLLALILVVIEGRR